MSTSPASYAASVVEVLRKHFPDLADPVTAGIIEEANERQACDQRDSFEFIVDDPGSANWRLKARSKDRRWVYLACYRMTERESDVQLVHTVNTALSVLETEIHEPA